MEYNERIDGMKYQNVIDLIYLIHDTFGLLTTEGFRDPRIIGFLYGTEPPHKPTLVLKTKSDLVTELGVIITGSYMMPNMLPMHMYDFHYLNECLLEIIQCLRNDLSCDEEVNQVKDWLKSIEFKNNIPA